MAWLFIIGGVVWWFAWSGISAAMFVKKGSGGDPRPGTGDVPAWVSVVMLVGSLALIGYGVILLFN